VSITAAEFNAQVIREFRARAGRVGGVFEGTPLLLLHHTGAQSGASRINPVGYMRDRGRYLIFASNGGAPRDPAWVGNLRGQPLTSIEVGSETIDVVAEQATGEERERLFALGAARFPQLAEYARKTDRVIPVIALTKTTEDNHDPHRSTESERGVLLTPLACQQAPHNV
jgi:deazaflavin-dependent oxidoreductase (nitroreductase family)